MKEQPEPQDSTARLSALFPVGSPTPNSDGSIVTRARQFTTAHLKVISSLGLAAVILTTWMVMRANSVPLDEPTQTPVWTQPASPSPTPAPRWLIHVMGAVTTPGVVELPQGARVIDAIEAAGGFTANADPADLNLAAILVDGAQIIIGTTSAPQGEVRQSTSPNSGSAPGSSGKVNLNQATSAQLESLPGVGPVTAAAILAWRQNNGSFTSTTQLQEVNGIGPKTFAQLEPYVCV